MKWFPRKKPVTIPVPGPYPVTLIIPFKYNQKGELLDRLSGEPITRLPLF